MAPDSRSRFENAFVDVGHELPQGWYVTRIDAATSSIVMELPGTRRQLTLVQGQDVVLPARN